MVSMESSCSGLKGTATFLNKVNMVPFKCQDLRLRTLKIVSSLPKPCHTAYRLVEVHLWPPRQELQRSVCLEAPWAGFQGHMVCAAFSLRAEIHSCWIPTHLVPLEWCSVPSEQLDRVAAADAISALHILPSPVTQRSLLKVLRKWMAFASLHLRSDPQLRKSGTGK